MTNYYTYQQTDGGYRGRVYTHTPDGNYERNVWLSEKTYDTPEEAIDAASDWAEEADVEVELG